MAFSEIFLDGSADLTKYHQAEEAYEEIVRDPPPPSSQVIEARKLAALASRMHTQIG